MATFTATQTGFLENGVYRGQPASTASTFAIGDTLAVGTQTVMLSSAVTIGAITSTTPGNIVLLPGGQLTTTNASVIIIHSPGVVPTTTSGSSIASGGSTAGVFTTLGN